MKLYLSTAIFTFFSTCLMAVTITWNGGGGYWNNPANWSTGTVPGSSDEVIISNGKAYIAPNDFAYAQTIEVEPGSMLVVDGNLTLANGYGVNALENYGEIHNGGRIQINNFDAPAGSSQGHGILNNDFIFNKADGVIIIENVKRSGIQNESNGYILTAGELEVTASHQSGIVNEGQLTNYYSSFLNIYDAGQDGIKNYGDFTNYGTLTIDGPDETGFENYGNFDQNGQLAIENTGAHGIYNQDQFNNNGSITTRNTGSRGLRNLSGAFNNYDLLDIRDVDSGAGIMLSNGAINNFQGATIIIQRVDGFSGIQIMSGAIPTFYNEGDIFISNTFLDGISCSARLENTSSGYIEIENSNNGDGLVITVSGTVENAGAIHINEVTQIGVNVYLGEFYNENGGEIEINDVGNHGLYVGTFSEFVNDNSTLVIHNGVMGDDIRNYGSIENSNCAHISVTGKIQNASNSTFSNGAWVYSTYSGNHANSGSFINNGAIGDFNGAFSNMPLQNNSVLAEPLTGNLQVGVPYPNALTLGSFYYIRVQGWFIDVNATLSAGSYNPNNNTFTPNGNAVGLDFLYLEVLNRDGCTTLITVHVPSPVSPLVAPGPAGIDIAESRDTPTVTVFPNPTTGSIQVKTGELASGDYQFRLLDAQGKVQYQVKTALNTGDLHRLELPSHLPSALYLLQLSNDQGVIDTQRLILQNGKR